MIIENEYFDWLYQRVVDTQKIRNRAYRRVLAHLHSVEFSYDIPLDGNRAVDGVDLRYRFGFELNYDASAISKLDTRPCSVLEMMVALALRMEEHIMSDSRFGDRTSQWFWSMMKNLRLDMMTDERYDKLYVDKVVNMLLARGYKPDGTDGLFTVKEPREDLRNVDIWYQMCWYINELLLE